MDRKGIAICAISETRWQGQGEFQCGEHLFLYSGTQEKTGQQGVAIVLNPVMARAWKSSGKQVNYICSRLMSVTISIGHDEFTFISVYAPTFMADEHTKDAFYHSVLQEIRSVKTGNTIVCLGDWNARVGVRDDDWKHVLGPFGNPERNDNGMRLLELCTNANLVVTNGFFKHKQYDTWQHARFKTWHTLDHVLVSRNSKKKVLDTKACLDANCDTDHRLVMTKIRPSRRRAGKNRPRNVHRKPRLNVQQLDEPNVRQQFQAEVHNQIQEAIQGKGKTYTRAPRGNEDAKRTIDIYTDGGCTLNGDNTKDTPAGWGIHINSEGHVTEMCGPVITDTTNKFFLGAEIGSNNTAELSAICEALLWVWYTRPSDSKIVIHPDSQYAINAALGVQAGQCNKDLVDITAELHRMVTQTHHVEYKWVKGHTGVHGNERADRLANQGEMGSTLKVGRYEPDAPPVIGSVQDMLQNDIPSASNSQLTYGEWSQAVTTAAATTLGFKKQNNRPDWQLENQTRIKELTDAKRLAFQANDHEAYKKVRNKCKTELRKMLNEWWAKQAEEMEESMDKHDLQGFYDKARKMGMLYKSTRKNATLKSKNGSTTLKTTQDRMDRWLEHHKEQLNVTQIPIF
jgi:ribonuclease HI